MKTFLKNLALNAAITVVAMAGVAWLLFSMKVCGLL